MRLNVPLFKQTTKLDCGPNALRMVLAYLGKNPGIKTLRELTEIKRGKGLSTIQLATAAAILGYETEFFSTHIGFNPEAEGFDYYKKFSDNSPDLSRQRIVAAKNAGVKLQERHMPLEELLSMVNENTGMIVLLDWNVVAPKYKGYHGHFVPVTGHTQRYIYVHDCARELQAFLPLTKNLFDKARTSKGTDEDLVAIYRK